MLGRWQHARALLRELTVSHKALSIVLTDDNKTGNLVIACLEPISIRSQITWEDSELAVDAVQLPDGSEGFMVVDLNSNVEIRCAAIEVRENVKLY